MGCVFPMVVFSIMPHAEFAPNDHQEGAPHFNNRPCEISRHSWSYDLSLWSRDWNIPRSNVLLSIASAVNGCRPKYPGVRQTRLIVFKRSYLFVYFSSFLNNLPISTHIRAPFRSHLFRHEQTPNKPSRTNRTISAFKFFLWFSFHYQNTY